MKISCPIVFQRAVWHRAALHTEVLRPGASSQADGTTHGEAGGGGD